MVATHDIDIVRGDRKQLIVGLSDGFFTDAAAYEGRLVLRPEQDDAAAALLTLVVDIQDEADPNIPRITHSIEFAMTPVQTQALPPHDVTCYCELRAKDGSDVRRLFNGRVRISD